MTFFDVLKQTISGRPINIKEPTRDVMVIWDNATNVCYERNGELKIRLIMGILTNTSEFLIVYTTRR